MVGLGEFRLLLGWRQEGREAQVGSRAGGGCGGLRAAKVETEKVCAAGVPRLAGHGERRWAHHDGDGFPAGEHEGLGRGVAVDYGVGAVRVGADIERGAFLGSGLALHGFEDPVGGVLARVFFEAGFELGVFEFVLGADEFGERDHGHAGLPVEGLLPVLLTTL